MAVAGRLISGGLSTPVYRLNLGGFDTHANQWNDHQILLQQLDEAIYAFIKDMSAQGLLNKVLIVTTSEFGRRVRENGSVGTDHGTASPVLFYGSALRGNIIGSQPNLANLDRTGNIEVQHDYREVYSTIMRDWFGLSDSIVKNVLKKDYQSLSFLHEPLSLKNTSNTPSSFKLHPAYPNPFNPTAMIQFELPNTSEVKIKIFSLNGRLVLSKNLGKRKNGLHEFQISPNDWAAGTYLIKVEALGSILTQRITYLK